MVENRRWHRLRVAGDIGDELSLTIYECKGYQPSSVVRAEEISDWLERRIPVINSAHRSEGRFASSSVRFEFWTCGTFEEEALRLLQVAKDRTRKYEIEWKDGPAVRQYATGTSRTRSPSNSSEHNAGHARTGECE